MQILFVGCGDHGGQTLLPAALSADLRITALVDHDLDRARRLAAQWSIPNVYASVEDVDASVFDAVVLALPVGVQADHVEWALRHHLPAFVEKPPAPDPQRLLELAALADETGAGCYVGMNFRWAQGVLALLAVLDSGRFGPACFTRIVHIARKPIQAFTGDLSLEASLFHAQGIHALDLAMLLLSGTGVVSGQMVSVDRGLLCELAADDTTAGRRFEASFGSCAAGFYHQVEVVTSHGDLLRLSELSELVHLPHGGTPDVTDYPGGRVLWRRSPIAGGYQLAGYASELAAFKDRLHGEAAPGLATLSDLRPVYAAFDDLLAMRGLKWTA